MTYQRDPENLAVMFLTFAALALTLLISAPVLAQVAGATLSGTVTDSSGAVIAAAQLSIKNVGTGVSRSLTTDAAGFYTAPNLLPGAYEITITAPGFSTEVRTGIELTVGAQQVLNLTLQVGSVTQNVQVTGAAPAIELASSTLSDVVSANTIRELPLNGRDWTLLAALQPGISSAAALQPPVSTGTQRGNRGYGTQLAIAGTRPQQNNYRIDGISANDYANGGPGSVLGSSLGVDAIQEFSVLSGNYSAEYGRTSGGVVNAITRSGTNNFHGDVFEFLRNSSLDAATFVDNAGGIAKPPFRQNQFGGALGGPILKDRTFFFADYEGIRQSRGLTNLDLVPSLDARNGIIHDANGTTCTIGIASPGCALRNSAGTVGVDPLVKPFLPIWPLPNGSLIAPGNTGNFSVATQQVGTENFASGRVDHKISDKDSLFGSYQYDKGLLTAPDVLNFSVTGNKGLRQLVSLEETHIVNPKLINNFRFGFNRLVDLNGYGISAANPLAADKSLSAVPGLNAPQIMVPGITVLSGGLNSGSYFQYYWNSFQGYDDAFLTRGNHALKFGIAVERMQLNARALSNIGGAFTYGSLVSFLSNQGGQGTQFSAQLPAATSPRGERQSIFGAYVQDDIRWRPNLTVNLGVRYEMTTVPTEVQGKTTSLYNITDPQPHCGVLVAGCVAVGPLWSNPTLRNFEPRVGFAWDPFHNGKTSVRSGFGLFDVLPLPYMTILPEISDAPFNQQGTLNPLANGAFPTGALNSIQAGARLRTPYIEPHPHRNYVMQWNLNVQRELLPNLIAMVTYVGSRGVHMQFRSDDINYVLPTATPQGYLWPCGGPIVAGLCTKPGTGTVVNPNIGQLEAQIWSENSFYDDFELQITKKLSHGFQVQGAYTWSKAIDEGSAALAGNTFVNSIPTPTNIDRRLRRGVADFNIAQKLVINYNWVLPGPRSLPDAAAWLLGGWQFGGIYTASTGVPFTAVLGGDPLGMKSRMPTEFPNRLVGPGCESAVNPGNANNYLKLQCFAFPNPSTLLGNEGRNSLTGPGLENFDFSLFKNNYIKRVSESFNVQFRAEFFNVFNRANFAAPTDRKTIFDQLGNPVAGAGVLDLLATPAREIQFALKLIW